MKNINIDIMRLEAQKSPCKVIKFSASDGKGVFSHNGEFYADCDTCSRTEIEEPYPNCRANHAEWGILAKSKNISKIYIYCATPDGRDYPFNRFWCRTCSILMPMFGVRTVFMWDGNRWISRNAKDLIKDIDLIHDGSLLSR